MECGGNDAAFDVRETTKTTKFPGRIENHEGHEVHEGFLGGVDNLEGRIDVCGLGKFRHEASYVGMVFTHEILLVINLKFIFIITV